MFVAARFTGSLGKEGTMTVWIKEQTYGYPLQTVDANRADNAPLGVGGKGEIEDLKIYHRSLSDAEILRLYELGRTHAAAANQPPPVQKAPEIVSYLDGSLEPLTSAIARDPSKNNNLNRARWFAVRHRWQESRADYEHVLCINASPYNYSELANLCLTLGDLEAYYQLCVDLEAALPAEPAGHRLFGALLLGPTQAPLRPSLWREKIEKIIATSPSDNLAKASLVAALYCNGTWAECIALP